MKTRARRITALLIAAAGGIANAQPVEPGPDVDAGTGASAQRPLWELGLGVAGLSLPDYRGSDQRHAYVLPLPYIVYRGTWLKADRDGARALLFDSARVKVDISAAASTPTQSSDNDARQGMPDLHGTFELGPNLNITLARSRPARWKLDLRLPLRAGFSIERSPRFVGTTFEPNLNLDLGGVAGGWNVGLLTGPVFADRKQHSYFYGVDPAYATATRPAYQAHGGYGGWRALAASSRRFGNAWVGAFLRYDQLRGATFDDSPLVRRRSALTFGFGVSWILATSSERVTAPD
jgi:outer membrane scaffolding protein for murein synthesis (MipA/OmpV family)